MTNYIVTEEQLKALQDCFTDATACMDYMSMARGKHTQKFAEILEAIKSEPEEASVGGWSAEDVHTACQLHNFTLSGEDAAIVLEKVSDDFDANDGINWDLIWDCATGLADENRIILLQRIEKNDQ